MSKKMKKLMMEYDRDKLYLHIGTGMWIAFLLAIFWIPENYKVFIKLLAIGFFFFNIFQMWYIEMSYDNIIKELDKK